MSTQDVSRHEFICETSTRAAVAWMAIALAPAILFTGTGRCWGAETDRRANRAVLRVCRIGDLSTEFFVRDNDKVEQELVATAEAAIEKHRQTDAKIRIVDTEGKPVNGVQITVDQTGHEFLFGCNIYMFDRYRNEAQDAAVDATAEEILATCPDGSAAVALRQTANGWSLFVGPPGLTSELLRVAARKAGVHLFTDTDCNVYANGSYVVLQVVFPHIVDNLPHRWRSRHAR